MGVTVIMPKIMPRKRTIAGALIVIGIAIGSYFGGLIPQLGGAGIGLNADNEESSEPSTPSTTENDWQFEVQKIVDVVIDGQTFAVLQADDGKSRYHRIELEKLIELAKTAPGDADLGIKVQVSRTNSALVSAEEKLKDALANAGLKDDQVHWKMEIVDQPELH